MDEYEIIGELQIEGVELVAIVIETQESIEILTKDLKELEEYFADKIEIPI